MQQVYDRLFVGDLSDCSTTRVGWAVIHACKSPCHQFAVGYRGSLTADHPNYLVLERGDDLFLNMIDPPFPLFKMESFTEFLRFAHERWKRQITLLIHCNQGESRAPALALLLMSKRLGVLSPVSYNEAAQEFSDMYPAYRPGHGIRTFLMEHWEAIK